jgi:hypothetical protein
MKITDANLNRAANILGCSPDVLARALNKPKPITPAIAFEEAAIIAARYGRRKRRDHSGAKASAAEYIAMAIRRHAVFRIHT